LKDENKLIGCFERIHWDSFKDTPDLKKQPIEPFKNILFQVHPIDLQASFKDTTSKHENIAH
jgi:hypothetical protein